MCGGPKVTPQYQGKTYRREAVTDLSKYAGAWKDGDSSQTLGGNLVAEQSHTDYAPQKMGNSPFGIASLATPQTGPFGMAVKPAGTTYNMGQHANKGVYGADDGSFISSQITTATPKFSGIGQQSAPAARSVDNYRYVEDSAGTYGAGGYSDKGTPSSFMSLKGHAVTSTSGAAKELSKPQGEPNKATIQQTAKKRKASVGTSKFKIDIGGTTRSSGLGIPT